MKLLERTFAILTAIAETPQGVGVTVLARQLGLAKSTTSRLLSALEAQGAIVRSAENTFSIGPTITNLNANQPFSKSLTTLARPILQMLVDETHEAASLCFLEGNQVHYVDQVQSQQAVQVLDWTGSRFPLHVLAAGKVFLAYGSAEFRHNYLSQPLAQFTPNSWSAQQLSAEFPIIRQNGYAATDEEFAEALVGWAAPVFDANQNCVAAVNVYGPKFRFDSAEKVAQLIVHMKGATQQLSDRLKTTP